ncbi:protein-export membrane protein SecD [Syntrophobotulus glycolicus DSM 8271]|uniref:Protein translocase subunit SecD n=1 Tax=Syntrophobotulus glycolicus (strain DSM 8271 / FlGlyR) TaxID=645991 RepID=F0T262_SYNGF|nr:protein translocase subunit SecD [Syntrophobotulus glycolicus]ADY56406.1 protein-export membrane protein SecD [Syntrophobotulus glycolicus DSM 8271]
MKRGNFVKLIACLIVIALAVGFSISPLSNPESGIPLGLDLRGGVHLVLQAEPKADGSEITADDMDKAKAIIEQRVNGMGVSEPYIQVDQGKKRVIVELAGIQDPDKAVSLLKTTAKLTFRDAEGNILLDGSELKEAKATTETSSGVAKHVVQIKFTSEGTKKFAEITTKNLNKNIGIYLDEDMIQNPRVNSPITTGEGIIEGYASLEEAAQYAVLLRSGSLPVSMTIAEKRQVGALLGADSINKSMQASLYAVIFIFLFMLLLYRLPGLVANLSLIVFALITLWILKGFGTVLTLPGIAGFILSIGMAVDLDIIVYERIKEEIALGKSLRSAVDAGFSRAIMTVFDSNTTTLICAATLIILSGSSAAVKGFAVTLAIGILVSFVTAITFTRWILRLIVGINPRIPITWFGAKEGA